MSDQKHDKDPHATDQQSDVMDEVLTEIDLDDLDMPLDEPDASETGDAEPDIDLLLSQTFDERRERPAEGDVFDELDELTLDDFIDNSEEDQSHELMPEATEQQSVEEIAESSEAPADRGSEVESDVATEWNDETSVPAESSGATEKPYLAEAGNADAEPDLPEEIAELHESLPDEVDHEDALSKLFGEHPDDLFSEQAEKFEDDLSAPLDLTAALADIETSAPGSIEPHTDAIEKDIRKPVVESPAPNIDLPETALPQKETDMPDKPRPAETVARTSKKAGFNLNLAHSIPMTLGLVAVLIAAVAVWLGLDASRQTDLLKAEPQKMQRQLQQIEDQLQQQNMAMAQQVEVLQLQLNDLTKVVANKATENWQTSTAASNTTPSDNANTPLQPVTTENTTPVQSASKQITTADSRVDAGQAWFVNLLSVEAQDAAVAEVNRLRARESEMLRLQVLTLQQQLDDLTTVIANNATVNRQEYDNTAALSVKGEVSPKPAADLAVVTEQSQPAAAEKAVSSNTETTASESNEPPTEKTPSAEQKPEATNKPAAAKAAAPRKFSSPFEVAPNSAKGWAVNMMSFDTAEAADAEVRRLRAKDVKAEFVRVVIKGTLWFRVRISGFASEHEAVAYEKYVSEFHGIDAWHHKL